MPLRSTILAASALALSAGTTAVSGIQANKQRKLGEQAEAEADKFMESARSELDVNSYDELSLNQNQYNKERASLDKLGQLTVEANANSDRPGTNTQNIINSLSDAQSKITDREVNELQDLDLVQAEEDSRLKDIGIQLDLGEVAGAQKAAADAEEAAAAYKKQFLSSLPQTAMSAVSMAVPLFQKSNQVKGLESFKFGSKTGADAMQSQLLDPTFQATDGYKSLLGERDFSGLGDLKGEALTDFLKQNFSGANMRFMGDPTRGNSNLYTQQTTPGLNKQFKDAGLTQRAGGMFGDMDIAQLEELLAKMKQQ